MSYSKGQYMEICEKIGLHTGTVQLACPRADSTGFTAVRTSVLVISAIIAKSQRLRVQELPSSVR